MVESPYNMKWHEEMGETHIQLHALRGSCRVLFDVPLHAAPPLHAPSTWKEQQKVTHSATCVGCFLHFLMNEFPISPFAWVFSMCTEGHMGVGHGRRHGREHVRGLRCNNCCLSASTPIAAGRATVICEYSAVSNTWSPIACCAGSPSMVCNSVISK